MADYKVYQNESGELEKVKIGISFSALCYTLFGALWLWMLTAELGSIFFIWISSIFIYTMLIKHLYIPFNEITIIGIFAFYLAPIFFGNTWIERRLKKSGYRLIHDTRFVKKVAIDAPERTLIGEAWLGNTSVVQRMIDAGKDVNETNAAGQTALDAASIRGNIGTVVMLLSKGAMGRTS